MNKNFIIAALSIVILSGFTSSKPIEYEYFISNGSAELNINDFNALGKQGWGYCGMKSSYNYEGRSVFMRQR